MSLQDVRYLGNPTLVVNVSIELQSISKWYSSILLDESLIMWHLTQTLILQNDTQLTKEGVMNILTLLMETEEKADAQQLSGYIDVRGWIFEVLCGLIISCDRIVAVNREYD
ncbi:unnamed protein product [Orchesella dallaii]|uniref:Uncharacterized protein n=1 Tax=Orchesella dallaii TaxID=48710 RepID=A0ABP1S6N8_9HEXA